MSTRKKPPAPSHPIAKAIEDVLLAGHTPRVHVDARRRDVEVPDHVRERWQARLVIDLDPSWPLRLEYGDDGLGVDLAFQGIVTRCTFGWKAIYVVLDRATGRGTVIEAQLPPHELPEADLHVPASPTNARGPRLAPPIGGTPPIGAPSIAGSPGPMSAGTPSKLTAHNRPTLVPEEQSPQRGKKAEPAQKADPKSDHASGRVDHAEPARRRSSRRDGGAARVEPPDEGPTETSASDRATSSEERARERRARFRVIDGGG